MNQPITFPDHSSILTKLFKEPIYRQDRETWALLTGHTTQVKEFFHQIGQELVLDEVEGFAYIRQIEPEDTEYVPRVSRRVPMAYHATLLLVCLRQEFDSFDISSPDAIKFTKSEAEMHTTVAAFVPETNNQAKDTDKIARACSQLVDLGFLKVINDDPREYEVMPIIKSKIGASELETICQNLKKNANDTANEQG